jgi:hypothetical protein
VKKEQKILPPAGHQGRRARAGLHGRRACTPAALRVPLQRPHESFVPRARSRVTLRDSGPMRRRPHASRVVRWRPRHPLAQRPAGKRSRRWDEEGRKGRKKEISVERWGEQIIKWERRGGWPTWWVREALVSGGNHRRLKI